MFILYYYGKKLHHLIIFKHDVIFARGSKSTPYKIKTEAKMRSLFLKKVICNIRILTFSGE